jgi:eukaryotic translation initiation factor 2C
VVYDEIFRSDQKNRKSRSAADELENLMHGFSYLFGRATKAVSVNPAAYYADLLCDVSELPSLAGHVLTRV